MSLDPIFTHPNTVADAVGSVYHHVFIVTMVLSVTAPPSDTVTPDHMKFSFVLWVNGVQAVSIICHHDIDKSHDHSIELPFIVFMLVPLTSVSCFDVASHEYWVLVALSHVLDPESVVIPNLVLIVVAVSSPVLVHDVLPITTNCASVT